ncbi:CDP-alcohol phosphatidyltransferase family protein [Myxococcota bacterium]|nr:CDP-alcohol phosphatidyltransferase family protein [Myxococcota bacterium]MCZ7619076.1 CDP-alcohol phosphatidyltransferase family protein [Myxococcota bacterium]
MADARLNAPNLVSAFRIACVPALLWLAADGAMNAVLVLFGLALASDAVDGALARRLGQETAFGARLDQWADFALWAALPLAAWWLWPEILRREAAYVILAVACMLLPTALAYLKYRAVPGYHTWSVKLGALAMALAIPLLLLFDIAWPFRIAALFQLVCAVDELGITLLSAECRHDVPSLLHALRLRRQSRA